MSDRMTPILFSQLLSWVSGEFQKSKTIFGIPSVNFFYKRSPDLFHIFDETIETPLGPAAGPHTQLAQNIIAAYLTGGRFFELKTVQILDELQVNKPCIDAQDEGYNVEWSQELKLSQSYGEYLKAWFALEILRNSLGISESAERGFVFNMSVGYTLEGIQTKKMDAFINSLKDASPHPFFEQCTAVVKKQIDSGTFSRMTRNPNADERIREAMKKLTPCVSGSVTLSTMHGCPRGEIEAIAKYLIGEKGLHTYIKLNPTLLGYNEVRRILKSLGYVYLELDEGAFEHDLQIGDAIPMLLRLKAFAAEHHKEFGVKLTNTLGVKNTRGVLAGDQMYMSGRSLFPLTINLASTLAQAIGDDLRISYSGGASQHNIAEILDAGIAPVTLVTDLLKPGGYSRLLQLAQKIDGRAPSEQHAGKTVDLTKLKSLAALSLEDAEYRKGKREIDSVKVEKRLEKFDCYIAPCAVACPIHQDVGEYIRLVEEGRYADAFEVVVRKNPLPHITGYICDHQCMNKCTRWDYDDPIKIRELKRVAAEKGFGEYLKGFANASSVKKNGVAVGIVGAGPSGLAAGYFLAKAGFTVTIFEQTEKAGGTVQHVIPNFRLPQSAIDSDVEFIRQHGVKFQFKSKSDLTIPVLQRNGFKYVYLAIGAPKPNQLPLGGSNRTVLDAVDFLKSFNKGTPPRLGSRIAVVGGGNSAMDAARASLRIPGAEKVYLVYRRTKEFMPADKEEFEAALREGTIFKELLLPVEFNGELLRCQKMRLGERGLDGRKRVVRVEDEFETLEIDTVISAIGENVDLAFLENNQIVTDENSRAKVSRDTNETMVANVYIGGDALRGPSTVVESIADGKKAAEAIMQKEGIAATGDSRLGEIPHPGKRFNDLQRARGIVEPARAQEQTEFIPAEEAKRCLGCNFVCDKCVDVCPNRANASIATPIANEGFKQGGQILHIDALCNECGNCDTFCPYSLGSPYKSKTTLFWSEEELLESSNDGFFIEADKNGANLFSAIVRFNNEVGTIVCDSRGSLLHGTLRISDERGTFNNFLRFAADIAAHYSYLIPSSSQR